MKKKSRVPGKLTDYNKHPSCMGGPTAVYGNYVYEFCLGHHLQNKWGWVAQYRLVAEKILGRSLEKGEVVHHADHNPMNNSCDNLKIMSRSEHQIHHMKINSEKLKKKISAKQVYEALQKTGGIKPAARMLGCCHSTIRNRFPDLCINYRRKSPTRIDDKKAIEIVLKYASNKNVGLREVVALTGISAMTVMRIADRHGIKWVKKTRSGEIHRTYRGKPVRHDLKTVPA